MYTTKSSRSAADFLQRLFFFMDGSFLNALHDNDSAFHKEFIQACQKLGISQYWSRPRTPTDNPVNENFNGTLKKEFLRFGNFHPDPVQFNKQITEYLITHTFIRPHQALGYDTPWEFYQKTAKVLLMSQSSFTGREMLLESSLGSGFSGSVGRLGLLKYLGFWGT